MFRFFRRLVRALRIEFSPEPPSDVLYMLVARAWLENYGHTRYVRHAAARDAFHRNVSRYARAHWKTNRTLPSGFHAIVPDMPSIYFNPEVAALAHRDRILDSCAGGKVGP